MDNLMLKAYQKFDDAVMYGVNKGVYSWNFTTGKTKADLANSLLTIAPIFEGVGAIGASSGFGGLFTLVFLNLSHIIQKKNKIQEKFEEEASKKECLSYEAESRKDSQRLFGPAWATLGTLYCTSGTNENITMGIGHITRGTADYVMRADYLPPRKNVFSKVKDRLVEKLKDVDLNPAPQPVPAPIFTRNRLEDYV